MCGVRHRTLNRIRHVRVCHYQPPKAPPALQYHSSTHTSHSTSPNSRAGDMQGRLHKPRTRQDRVCFSLIPAYSQYTRAKRRSSPHFAPARVHSQTFLPAYGELRVLTDLPGTRGVQLRTKPALGHSLQAHLQQASIVDFPMYCKAC